MRGFQSVGLVEVCTSARETAIVECKTTHEERACLDRGTGLSHFYRTAMVQQLVQLSLLGFVMGDDN